MKKFVYVQFCYIVIFLFYVKILFTGKCKVSNMNWFSGEKLAFKKKFDDT